MKKGKRKIIDMYSDLGKWEVDSIGNMYLSIGEGEKSLLLNAHIDTVPVDSDKINVILDNNIIRSDGKQYLVQMINLVLLQYLKE